MTRQSCGMTANRQSQIVTEHVTVRTKKILIRTNVMLLDRVPCAGHRDVRSHSLGAQGFGGLPEMAQGRARSQTREVHTLPLLKTG